MELCLFYLLTVPKERTPKWPGIAKPLYTPDMLLILLGAVVCRHVPEFILQKHDIVNMICLQSIELSFDHGIAESATTDCLRGSYRSARYVHGSVTA
jgi:hypothetical protein